jgi:prepilin-type N-terminal cleavage/methylation domain-containing protein
MTARLPSFQLIKPRHWSIGRRVGWPRQQNRYAFTLIEIMIVIAIIAIFMTVGIPSMMRALEKDELSRAVHDTIEGCKTARDRAILQGVPWVFIVRENGQLDVQAAPQEDLRKGARSMAASTKNIPASPYSGFPRKLGEDVMVQEIGVNFISYMQAPEARVRFFPNGTADEFTVVYAFQTRQRSVTIDIITGQATEYIRQ